MEELGYEELLGAAAENVGGDRREAYGSPFDNHKRIAWLWTFYLMERARGNKEFELTPSDVAAMMILLKIARLVHTPGHFDSLVDIAGYAAVAWEVEDKPSEYRDGNKHGNEDN